MFSTQHYKSDTIAISAMDVIEQWRLCYHLGCVVHYLANPGHTIEDLKKAEYYLSRELTRYQKQFSRCQLALVDSKQITTNAILQNWRLSFRLAIALQYIEAAQIDATMRQTYLQEALRQLQAEIRGYL